MTRAPHARLRFVVCALTAAASLLTFASAASAVRSRFFEETAEAFWVTSTDNLKSVTATGSTRPAPFIRVDTEK